VRYSLSCTRDVQSNGRNRSRSRVVAPFVPRGSERLRPAVPSDQLALGLRERCRVELSEAAGRPSWIGREDRLARLPSSRNRRGSRRVDGSDPCPSKRTGRIRRVSRPAGSDFAPAGQNRRPASDVPADARVVVAVGRDRLWLATSVSGGRPKLRYWSRDIRRSLNLVGGPGPSRLRDCTARRPQNLHLVIGAVGQAPVFGCPSSP
jgi:hypothetical protein